jgi:hypothetical protein
MKLKNINLEEFIPMKDSTEFKLPYVKAYSYRSKLYHEKMIENIVLTSLNKVAYKSHDNRDDKLKTSIASEEKLVDALVQRTNCKIF